MRLALEVSITALLAAGVVAGIPEPAAIGSREPEPTDVARAEFAPVAADTIIRSERWPPVGVSIDTAFRYLGTRTISVGSSTAEIHVLVEADGSEVGRFYWIQFEGRSPDRPGIYDYSSLPHRDTIDDYVFHTDVRYGAYTASEIENEPDTGTVGAILADHGYDFPAPMMRARMVALDEARRNELLVIYMEALDWSGTALEDLEAGEADWAGVSAGLRERAAGGLGLAGE